MLNSDNVALEGRPQHTLTSGGPGPGRLKGVFRLVSRGSLVVGGGGFTMLEVQRERDTLRRHTLAALRYSEPCDQSHGGQRGESEMN